MLSCCAGECACLSPGSGSAIPRTISCYGPGSLSGWPISLRPTSLQTPSRVPSTQATTIPILAPHPGVPSRGPAEGLPKSMARHRLARADASELRAWTAFVWPSTDASMQRTIVGHAADSITASGSARHVVISWFAMVTESVLSKAEARFSHAWCRLSGWNHNRSNTFKTRGIATVASWRLCENHSRQLWRYMIRESKVIRDRCCSTAVEVWMNCAKSRDTMPGFPDQSIQRREVGNHSVRNECAQLLS